MPHDAQTESEWQTRKSRIDKRLADLGWTVAPFRPGVPLADCQNLALTEYETANGPSDYAL